MPALTSDEIDAALSSATPAAVELLRDLATVSTSTPPDERPAPQVRVCYRCPKGGNGRAGHEFVRTFSAEGNVTPPEFSDCPRHGVEGRLAQATGPDTRTVKPPRTHWDMLRERRSIPELEALLAERLTELRRAGDTGTPESS